MKMYLENKEGNLIMDVNNRGLVLAFDDGMNKPRVLNVQEYEILNSRDTVDINQVIVKNHGDFQGTVDDLMMARVIHKKPVRFVEVGYIKYGVYRLTPNAVSEIYRQSELTRHLRYA